MPNMSAMTFWRTPCAPSSSTRLTKTSFATCASGARSPADVASSAINTVVCWTIRSIRSFAFIIASVVETLAARQRKK